MSTEKEFDYQAYMRDLPHSDESSPDPIKIHRGPGARQERREAAEARIPQKEIITTVAQFHARLEELDAGKMPFLYRGQPESRWPVNCSAVRRLTGYVTNPIENQLIDPLLVGYLAYLLGKARRRGFVPFGLDESATDLELMAHLQHQGAATGLIDFTRQPLAALWFACHESSSKDGAVYALPHSEVAETNQDSMRKKIRFFYGGNKPWSWEPPALGNRIVAQSSIFVFGVSTIRLPKMEKLTIQATSKDDILRELEAVYGINEEELFPDFFGYAVANSSTKTFAISQAIDYWKEQIDSVGGGDGKARAHYECGLTYHAVQKYPEAIEHYDEAIRLNPQYAEAYDNRGIAKNALGRHKEAIADYDGAIRIDPQHVNAYNNRGIAKAELGKHEEAAADYDEAIRIDPQYANAYYNRGSAKNKLGRHEEAITDFDEAVRIDPQDAAVYNNRGNAKGGLGRCEEAIADFDEAIRIDPKHANAYYNRGVAKGKLNRYKEAIADYDEAIRIDPKHANAYYNRGIAKDRLGMAEADATVDYHEAKRLDPQLPGPQLDG